MLLFEFPITVSIATGRMWHSLSGATSPLWQIAKVSVAGLRAPRAATSIVRLPVIGAVKTTFSYRFRVVSDDATTAAPFSTRRFRLFQAVVVKFRRCHVSTTEYALPFVTGIRKVLGLVAAVIVEVKTLVEYSVRSTARSSRRKPIPYAFLEL